MSVSAAMSDTEGLIASGADARLIHLAEILEESLDYVATTDLYGQILYANRAFRDRFGLHTIDGIASESYSLFSFFTEHSRDDFMRDAVPQLWHGGRWTGEVDAIDPTDPSGRRSSCHSRRSPISVPMASRRSSPGSPATSHH
ncbi:MAG: hypothetical protein JWL72_4556 [Ilumatobacteraceae bacterium]|nr:hypothetical protein [Ilumatobacteraceae bacterium]